MSIVHPAMSGELFSGKTVFVLDHTQYFGITSDNLVDLDFGKTKPNVPPLVPISKSLWTCAVESAIEYCRIAWDLFPSGKLIRFVVSDSNAHIVNTWQTQTQNVSHISNAMTLVGLPPRAISHTNEFSVIHGLRAAAEALAEPSEAQLREIAQSAASGTAARPTNCGRVICITSARDNESMTSLEEILTTLVSAQNKLSASPSNAARVAAGGNPHLVIDRCHFVLINMYPSSMDSQVCNREPAGLSLTLQTEIHSVKASDIAAKLTHLILPHYDLASTTVTGIPMKEEQNASSSANYDVEIFHSRHAHSVIAGCELELPTGPKEGHSYETVTLRWCTPRGLTASDLQPCQAQHRVTPVDVTSRPSSCLINFLLNGRSVLLEMPSRTAASGKVNSHLLSAHGGEIFIHTLHTARSCLEDPPSVLEGVGGRVTDYRITDFSAMVRQQRLYPLRVSAADLAAGRRQPDDSLRSVRAKLRQRTQYWPLTLKTTIMYNVPQFAEALLAAAAKARLSAEEVLQCQQVVYGIVALEQRHEALPLPGIGPNRLRGAKNEEQYRLLWAELEAMLAGGADSVEHRMVLQCVRDCYRSRHPVAAAAAASSSEAVAKAEGGGSSVMMNILVHKPLSDSPLSPPLAKAKVKRRTLLEIFTTAERERTQKRVDFSGRLCTPPGQIAKLYPNLGLKDVNARTDGDGK